MTYMCLFIVVMILLLLPPNEKKPSNNSSITDVRVCQSLKSHRLQLTAAICVHYTHYYSLTCFTLLLSVITVTSFINVGMMI